MKKVSCVIWDWNGTLLDDAAVCLSTMNELLHDRGLALISSLEHYRALFRFPVLDYYKNVGLDFSTEPFEVLAKTYIDKYRLNSQSCGLHIGALEAIKTIHQQGIAQIILSASEKQDLLNQLTAFKIKPYFNCILGLDNIYAKSKLELGQKWLREQNVRCDEIVLIGDTTHDYEVAKELRCNCVLVANGHQSKAVLKSCNCMVVDRVEQVLDLI